MIETRAELAVRCVDEAEMTPEMDAAIREMLCECFPADVETFRRTRAWHGSAPEYSLVGCEGEQVVGHVGVVAREIMCDGVPVKIAGVQNVAVRPRRRGEGIAQRLLIEAMEEAARRGIPYGVLFCLPELERFYGSLGWERVETEVTMVEGGAEVVIDKKNVTMVKDLNGVPLRPSQMHLLGADW